MKNIAAALVKAQKSFGPALKTSTNPHFKSRYADLAACVEAVIEGLNSNGIMLVQQCHESSDGVTVETVFVHESGETFSAGKLHVPAAKQDPQGYGSALTYARRYSLMAACGIAPEDDDGNSATSGVNVAKAIAASNAKPTAGLLDSVPVERRPIVQRSFTEIVNHLAKGDEHGAFQIYDEITNAVERGALRGMLDSTQKAALKAIADQQEPKKAA